MTPQSPDRNAVLADLLARTALADQRAFAELYRSTSSHLYAVALRILREPAAAEEVLQEAFVSVWHHAGGYAPSKSQPRTWLTSIVRNRCLDRLRRRDLDTVTLTRDDDEETEEPETVLVEAAPRKALPSPRERRSPRSTGTVPTVPPKKD